jgi:hypothetical protein
MRDAVRPTLDAVLSHSPVQPGNPGLNTYGWRPKLSASRVIASFVEQSAAISDYAQRPAAFPSFSCLPAL